MIHHEQNPCILNNSKTWHLKERFCLNMTSNNRQPQQCPVKKYESSIKKSYIAYGCDICIDADEYKIDKGRRVSPLT